MNMAESQLNDAELRYVRAAARLAAKHSPSMYPSLPDKELTEWIYAARDALPAPTPEPEIVVVDAFSGNDRVAVIRKGDKWWHEGQWRSDRPYTRMREDADLIAEALRAREKAAKRPRIELVKGTDDWGVQCGNYMAFSNGAWNGGRVETGYMSESSARALAAKLEAEQNYPPGMEVTK